MSTCARSLFVCALVALVGFSDIAEARRSRNPFLSLGSRRGFNSFIDARLFRLLGINAFSNPLRSPFFNPFNQFFSPFDPFGVNSALNGAGTQLGTFGQGVQLGARGPVIPQVRVENDLVTPGTPPAGGPQRVSHDGPTATPSAQRPLASAQPVNFSDPDRNRGVDPADCPEEGCRAPGAIRVRVVGHALEISGDGETKRFDSFDSFFGKPMEIGTLAEDEGRALQFFGTPRTSVVMASVKNGDESAKVLVKVGQPASESCVIQVIPIRSAQEERPAKANVVRAERAAEQAVRGTGECLK